MFYVFIMEEERKHFFKNNPCLLRFIQKCRLLFFLLKLQKKLFCPSNTAFDFRARLRFPRVTREPPPLRLRGLTCLAAVLRGTCHKPNRPRRQRAPSRPIRLMPPASEQSTSAFLIGHFSRRSLRLALQSTAGTAHYQ
jgi:hypothetical protein